MESECSATWYMLLFVFFQCEIKALICVCVIIIVIISLQLHQFRDDWLQDMFAEEHETVNDLISKELMMVVL